MARAVLRTSFLHKQVTNLCGLGTPHSNLVLLITSHCPLCVLWCGDAPSVRQHSSQDQDAPGKTMDAATDARESCRVW